MKYFNKLPLVSLLLPILFLSCSETQLSNNVINIDNALVQTSLVSDCFESIEYIPLETNDKCLIGRNPSFYLLDDNIVVISSGNCHLFDRKSGKFIRKIGSRGRGHGEYLGILGGVAIDEQGEKLIASRGNTLIEYSLNNGKMIEPSMYVEVPSLWTGMAISDDLWVTSQYNLEGDSRNQLLFFDRNKIVDSIANTDKFTLKNANEINVLYKDVHFYRYNNNGYYKPLHNDTIYNISNRKLEPKWIFEATSPIKELGLLRGDSQRYPNESKNYHLIYDIMETDDYIFFSSVYQRKKDRYLYNKHNQELIKLEHNGFIYDINSEMAFWPTYATQNGSIASMYEAGVLLEHIDNMPEDVKINSEFKNLQTIASELDEEDNPVIIVVKLKK